MRLSGTYSTPATLASECCSSAKSSTQLSVKTRGDVGDGLSRCGIVADERILLICFFSFSLLHLASVFVLLGFIISSFTLQGTAAENLSKEKLTSQIHQDEIVKEATRIQTLDGKLL